MAHREDPFRRTLKDGRRVQLDRLGPDDRDDLLAGFEGLSPESRYLRFFSAMPTLPDFIIDGLLNTDPDRHVAIGARLVNEDGTLQPRILGVARYYRSEDDPSVAEPAIAVVDAYQGLGLGKILLKALSVTARDHGITRFRAQVLGNNRKMRAILRNAGAVFVDFDEGVLTYEIDITRRPAPRHVLRRLLSAMLSGQRSEEKNP